MRFRGYVVGKYVIRVTGLSHVATLDGSEVAYSQSKAGMRRALRGHKEGRAVREDNGHTFTKGAYAS